MVFILKHLSLKKYFLLKIFFISLFLYSDPSFSQILTPPKGLVVFRLGYRSYTEQTYKYNQNGDKVNLGDSIYTTVNLSELLSGALSNNKSGSGLFNFLNKIGIVKSWLDQDIGSIQGDISADVNAKYFALAFGITDNLAMYVAPSWINLNLNINIYYEENEGITKPFGGAVTNLIKNNFDKLVTLYIDSLEYKNLEDWSYSGFGDTRVSLLYGMNYNLGRLKYFSGITGLDLQLSIPTGYKESADMLQDMNLERGYYFLSLEYIQKLIYRNVVWLDTSLKGGYSFSTEKEVRVPEVGSNGLLLSKDRTTKVTWKPGNEMEMGVGINGFLGFVHPRVGIGYKKHSEDEYSGGDLEGNYKKLSEGSESTQSYTDFSVEIDTTRIYAKTRFILPFMLSFRYHKPMKSKNYMEEKYFELYFQSFIPTPMFNKNSIR